MRIAIILCIVVAVVALAHQFRLRSRKRRLAAERRLQERIATQDEWRQRLRSR